MRDVRILEEYIKAYIRQRSKKDIPKISEDRLVSMINNADHNEIISIDIVKEGADER